MNRKVKSIKTHSTVFFGGNIGDLGDSLPSVRSSVELNMFATEIGVVVEAYKAPSPTARGGKATALIPYGNIKIVLLEDAPRTEVAASDKPAA